MIDRADLERDAVIVACAISAGIHAALTPGHMEEGAAAAGGFALAAVLLAGFAVALTRRPTVVQLAGSAAVFAGLLVSYGFAITTGVPVLHPDAEPVDGLGVFTKTVELAGLLAAIDLIRHPLNVVPRPKGLLA